ncbi:MAG: hypothetical protein ACRDL5_06265 [Solirubrobacteraceae bacterium]
MTLALDGDLVDRARERSGHSSARDDAQVVEEALAVYVGMRALDDAQAETTLSEDEASRLAYAELDALRRERRRAV